MTSDSQVRRNISAAFATVVLLAVVCFSWVLYIDPLWLGTHTNPLNRYQRGYDERLTKTLRLAFGTRLGEFDAVLLGSSRASYLPADAFQHRRVFNYAVSAVYPGEYLKMLEFFSQAQGEPGTIIVGADFFGTRQDWEDRIGPYLDKGHSMTFLLSKLISGDSVRRATEIAVMNLFDPVPPLRDDLYDRVMIKTNYRKPGHSPYYRPMMRKYCSLVYGESYRWNTDLPAIYRGIAEKFKRSKFLIYTSPTTGRLFDALVHSGRYEDYERWLRLMVSIFGEVIDVMGHNEFTDNPENYYDYHHFTAEGGRWLVRNVIDAQVPAVGRRITRGNLEAVIDERRMEAAVILRERQNPCAEFDKKKALAVSIDR